VTGITNEMVLENQGKSGKFQGAPMSHFLKRILSVYLAPYWKQGLLLIGCFATLIAFDTIFPLGMKFLIDMAITPRNTRMLGLIIAGLATLYLVSSFGALAADYLDALVTARLTNALRLKMFDHLQNLPASFYSHMQSGDVMTRFSTDLNALEYALKCSIIPGIQYVLQVVVSIVVLFLLDVRLSVVTILLLPLSFILPKLLVDRATKLTMQRRTVEAGISSAVQESLQAHAVTRMFGLRAILTAGFTRQTNRLTGFTVRSDFTNWSSNRAAFAGQYLIQLLVIGIGATQIFNNHLSVGSLVGFVALLNSLAAVISLVSYAFAGLVPAVPSLGRIEELLNEKPQVNDNPTVTLPRFTGQVCFEQVSFSYAGPQGKPALEQVDFSIPYGTSAAFIGRSGSGKSTVLNLLMRSHDPNQGRILIDGHNIQQVSLASLRSQMGVVFQDTFLFNLSLRENIRMGRTDATDAEVEVAAQAAGVHETILGLPGGYDTPAGEQGKMLSGGQRQRIALARAILRRPALLLLDESTSGLDLETETHIYETLKKLRGTCTILAVTHRLAPVADMDQIVVLDQGRVCEQGTHAGLMGRMGLYYGLFTRQSGFTISPDGLYAEVTPQRLKSIPLFEKLEQPALELLASQFVSERCDSGHTVMQAGDLGDKFYIIVRGKVAVTTLGQDKQPAFLNSWQDGDYFGEIALLEGGRRTATVTTTLPSLFLTLERKHFMNMLASHPAVRAAIEQEARSRRSRLDAVQACVDDQHP
jgi:ATP-binding cassette subfamily B protein